MEKYITNKKGETFTVLIDDEDEELYDRHTWCVGAGYVRTNMKGGRSVRKSIRLHRLILNITDKNTYIDHINGNGLDNRKCNLRVCKEKRYNQFNLKIDRKGKKLKYKGVTTKRKKFEARICINYKTIRLGTHDTQEQAARAYDEAAKKHFGEFAKLNFPE